MALAMTQDAPAGEAVVPAASNAVGAKVTANASQWLSKWWNGRSLIERYLRHAVAIAAWGYLVLQLFIFDLDAWLLGRLPAWLHGVVIFKFWVFLVTAAIILRFTPRRIFWSWTLYVVLYPFTRLAIGFWKAAKLTTFVLIKLRSWSVFFVFLNLCFSFVSAWKINFLLYSITAAAIFSVFVSSDPITLNSAAALLSLVIVVQVGRRLFATFKPTPVFHLYVRATAWAMDNLRRRFIKPTPIRGIDVSGMSLAEFEKKHGDLSTAVILTEFCGFLQDRFKQYNKSGMALATYVTLLAVLFLTVTVLLTVVNLAVFKADPGSFVFTRSHNLFDFFDYSFGAVTGQRGGLVLPISTGARLVSMLETVLGWLFAAGTLLSLYFGLRQGREKEEIENAILGLQDEKRRMNEYMEREFSISVNDAIGLLEKLQGGVVTFINLLRGIGTD